MRPPVLSPRTRQRGELTERDWENAVQGLTIFSIIEDWDSGFYWRTAILAIVITNDIREIAIVTINETWYRRLNYKEEEGWDSNGVGILKG